jgi:hypothetical protein
MVFRDDDSRLRNSNAPANLAAIRDMAQNLIRIRKGTLSLKANRKAPLGTIAISSVGSLHNRFGRFP